MYFLEFESESTKFSIVAKLGMEYSIREPGF